MRLRNLENFMLVEIDRFLFGKKIGLRNVEGSLLVKIIFFREGDEFPRLENFLLIKIILRG